MLLGFEDSEPFLLRQRDDAPFITDEGNLILDLSLECIPDPERLAAVRKELSSLVGAYARRTGAPHAVVHAKLRSTCGGPAVPEAARRRPSAPNSLQAM